MFIPLSSLQLITGPSKRVKVPVYETTDISMQRRSDGTQSTFPAFPASVPFYNHLFKGQVAQNLILLPMQFTKSQIWALKIFLY